MNDDIPEIIVRILQGNQTEEDMHIFLLWYRASQENKNIFFQLKQIYDLRKGGLAPDAIEVKASWDRLWIKLKKQSITDSPLSKTIWNRHYSNMMKFAIAAAIAVVLIVTGIYISYKGEEDQIEWTEVGTGIGNSPQTIVLSDGSIVRLNSSSLFRYPEKFNGNSREVYLDGEAYFNVAKDGRRAFIVHTDKQSINVLGTEFNVLGYSSDPYTVTTLVKGKVRLDTYDNENNLKNEIVMNPSQQVYFDKEFQQTTLSGIDPQDAILWMKGVYSFRDVSLEEITRRFEKIYGVTIIIPDEADRKEEYTGKFFAHQSIKEVMNVINFKGQFRLQINDDTVFLRRKHLL